MSGNHSSDTDAACDIAAGGAKEFDRHWELSRRRPDKHLLYSVGAPRTVTQMYHRGYVEDLWALMRERAEAANYLELGCGRGTTSMYLAARGCNVTMLDLAPTALKLAEECFESVGLACPKLILGSAEATGLPANSFDCVYNIGLLEHFADPTRVLQESMRLLRPNGLLFSVIVPEIPPGNRLLTQSLFCPWRVPRTLRNQYLYRRNFQPQGAVGRAVMRTAYSREQYISWLLSMNAVDVRCVPYNPYHELDRNSRISRLLQLPVYRLHRALRKRFASAPTMRTSSLVAQCDLLIGRKS